MLHRKAAIHDERCDAIPTLILWQCTSDCDLPGQEKEGARAAESGEGGRARR